MAATFNNNNNNNTYRNNGGVERADNPQPKQIDDRPGRGNPMNIIAAARHQEREKEMARERQHQCNGTDDDDDDTGIFLSDHSAPPVPRDTKVYAKREWQGTPAGSLQHDESQQSPRGRHPLNQASVPQLSHVTQSIERNQPPSVVHSRPRKALPPSQRLAPSSSLPCHAAAPETTMTTTQERQAVQQDRTTAHPIGPPDRSNRPDDDQPRGRRRPKKDSCRVRPHHRPLGNDSQLTSVTDLVLDGEGKRTARSRFRPLDDRAEEQRPHAHPQEARREPPRQPGSHARAEIGAKQSATIARQPGTSKPRQPHATHHPPDVIISNRVALPRADRQQPSPAHGQRERRNADPPVEKGVVLKTGDPNDDDDRTPTTASDAVHRQPTQRRRQPDTGDDERAAFDRNKSNDREQQPGQQQPGQQQLEEQDHEGQEEDQEDQEDQEEQKAEDGDKANGPGWGALYNSEGFVIPLTRRQSGRSWQLPVCIAGNRVIWVGVSTARRTLTLSTSDLRYIKMRVPVDDLVCCLPAKSTQLYCSDLVIPVDEDLQACAADGSGGIEPMRGVRVGRYDYYVGHGKFSSRIGLLGGPNRRSLFAHLRLPTDLFALCLVHSVDRPWRPLGAPAQASGHARNRALQSYLALGQAAKPPRRSVACRLVPVPGDAKGLLAVGVCAVHLGAVRYTFRSALCGIVHTEVAGLCVPARLFGALASEITRRSGLFDHGRQRVASGDRRTLAAAARRLPHLAVLVCRDIRNASHGRLMLRVPPWAYTCWRRPEATRSQTKRLARIERRRKRARPVPLFGFHDDDDDDDDQGEGRGAEHDPLDRRFPDDQQEAAHRRQRRSHQRSGRRAKADAPLDGQQDNDAPYTSDAGGSCVQRKNDRRPHLAEQPGYAHAERGGGDGANPNRYTLRLLMAPLEPADHSSHECMVLGAACFSMCAVAFSLEKGRAWFWEEDDNPRSSHTSSCSYSSSSFSRSSPPHAHSTLDSWLDDDDSLDCNDSLDDDDNG